MSHTVQVVSIEDVTIRLGDIVFHEKEVRGAEVGFGFLDCRPRMSAGPLDRKLEGRWVDGMQGTHTRQSYLLC